MAVRGWRFHSRPNVPLAAVSAGNAWYEKRTGLTNGVVTRGRSKGHIAVLGSDERDVIKRLTVGREAVFVALLRSDREDP